MLEIGLCGERVWLHSQRALWWARRSLLAVADVHLGKDSVFRRHGLAIPRDVSLRQLERLTALLAETGARRLVVLGDFLHGVLEASDPLHSDLLAWRERHRAVRISVILGNHDRGAASHALSPAFELHADPMAAGPFRLAHEPDAIESRYTLAGHIHPGMVLRDRGRSSAGLRLPAFWFGERIGILPAFGSFTGLAQVAPGPRDRVFVAGDGQVVPVRGQVSQRDAV